MVAANKHMKMMAGPALPINHPGEKEVGAAGCSCALVQSKMAASPPAPTIRHHFLFFADALALLRGGLSDSDDTIPFPLSPETPKNRTKIFVYPT
jgi:hypothetical protein